MSVVRCTRRGCGTILVDRMDDVGRLMLVCLGCERQAQGICRDCSQPTGTPSRWRCASHKKARQRELDRQSYARTMEDPTRRAKILARQRKRMSTPEARARENNRRHRKPKSPRSEIDRAYQRAWCAKAKQDPAYREAQNQKQRERRAAKRERDAAAYEAKLARKRAEYARDMAHPLLREKREGVSRDYYVRTRAKRLEMAAAYRKAKQTARRRSEKHQQTGVAA